ncbi:MAG: autotransporter domain-containing protein, partial [Pseudomonadota bacterium]
MHPKFKLNSGTYARVLKWPLVLCTSVCAPYALAQDISTETTEPVTTSTIDDGAPGDLTITEDGSIELTGIEGQVAVTMDSDNNITHDGTILIEDTNSVTGILMNADRTGDLTMSGTISLLEDYTREDDDDDDDLDGPLAIGEDRVAIRLESGGTHTGDINLQTGSSIVVEGNNSAGLILGSMLDGSLTLDGAISIIGEDTVGVEIDDGVTGDILLSGGVTVQGANARAVSIDGNVDGNLTVESTISVTGFTSTTVDNYVAPTAITDDTPAVEDRIDAEDLNDSGPALAIGGSLGNGFLVNGSVDNFTSTEDEEDETKDTVDDFDENRTVGIINSRGSSPAVLISPDLNGAATEDIVLGTVVETVRDTTDDDEDEDFTETLATFTYDQGFINRGAISADGLNVGFDATALRIEGSEDGAFTTQITGGILNDGNIGATAYEADATAMDLGSGAIIGAIENDGSITADVSTLGTDTATGLLIGEGADVSTLANSGTIRTRSIGETGNATAVLDLNGDLSTITNTGTISASLLFNGVDPDIAGAARAFDLTASSADVTIEQFRETPVEDINLDGEINTDDVSNPILVGDILFGSGNDTLISTAGSIAGDTYFNLGDGVLDLSGTTYEGDVFFTDGSNTASLASTTFTGDFSFGGVTNSLSIESSTFTGELISAGALDSLTVDSSDLFLTEGTAAVMNALSMTGESLLEVDINPQSSFQPTSLTVMGAATLGEDVTIRPNLLTITSTDFTHTFIDAGTLTFDGTLDDTLIEDTPYIYNVELVVSDEERDTLDLEFNLKTPEQLGLDLNQSAAFSAVLDVFSSDDDLGAALADITDAAAFNQVYNLLLPQRTDAATRYLSSQGTAAFGALGNRLKALSNSDDRPRSVWAQEYFTFIDIEEDTNVPGYNGSGLGFAAGADSRIGPLDIAGLFVNYSSGDFEEKTGGTNPVTTSSIGIGLYAKESLGPLDFVVSSQINKVDFNSLREVDLADVTYQIRGEWEGTSAMASARVSSEFNAGRFYARPQVSYDVFQLDQDGYTESGDDRLSMVVSSADTDRSTASAVLDLGARLPIGARSTAVIVPEVSLGYRTELSSKPYVASAHFLG